ncbi:MAG: hypothetical protein ACK5SX_00415 [Sandaracinobacter sp.]
MYFEVETIFTDFEALPSSDTLLNLSYVCEVLLINPSNPLLKGCCDQAAERSLEWLKAGLLTEVLFSHAEHAYPIALLVALSRRSDQFDIDYLRTLADLVAHKIILMSELPYLSLSAIHALFGTDTVSINFEVLPSIALKSMIDKRVLRSRSDEYDVTSLMHAMSVVKHHQALPDQRPFVFATALLMRAIRNGDANWLAVLAYLCHEIFPCNQMVLAAAYRRLDQSSLSDEGIMPPPSKDVLYPEFLERSDRGLKLRSSLARSAFMESVRA